MIDYANSKRYPIPIYSPIGKQICVILALALNKRKGYLPVAVKDNKIIHLDSI
jgi:hypothetical protein